MLTDRFSEIKKVTGYDSDAECMRYLINTYQLFVKNKNEGENEKEAILDGKINRAMKRIEEMLPKYIEKKFGGVLPSLKDQAKLLDKNETTSSSSSNVSS